MSAKRLDPILTLETDRLILQPLTNDDRALVYELYGNQKVTAGFGREAFTDKELDEKASQLLGSWKTRGFCQFGVVDKATGAKIGIGGIRPTAESGVGEIGCVFNPEWWGKGIATEAVSKWIEWGFEVLKLSSIIANVVDNPASIRVLQKYGFDIVKSDENGASLVLPRPASTP